MKVASARMVCQHNGEHSGHARSLLCLTAEIRSRIYIAAGFVNNCRRVNLTPPRHRVRDWVHEADWRLLRELRFSLSLMQTCKLIHEETSRLFYSSNRFVAQYLDDSRHSREEASLIGYETFPYMIRYLDDSRLSALSNLRPQSITHLTHLTLYLNVTRCRSRDPYTQYSGSSWEWADWWRPDDAPLSFSSDRDRQLLRRWSEVAQHLAANVAPSSLHLCLGCDAEDKSTAMLVLTPLLQWPRLASCVIRLGQSTNKELQDVADHFVAQLSGVRTVSDLSPFPFMSLPRELRLDILRYTDLVTPLCEVTWTRELGYHTRFISWRPDCCHNGDGGRWMGAAPWRSCYQSSMGCFCPKYHAVSPSGCTCWSPPTSLFLVCQLMKADAEEVFFRANRFVILHSGGKHFVAKQTPTQLEASYFLRSVIDPQKLAAIRFLELAFPPFEEDYLKVSEPAHQDWLNTIDHLQTHMCLSRLTLRVYMRDQIPVWFGRLEVPFRANMTKEKIHTIIGAYFRLLCPLRNLKGLHRLFIHVALPNERGPSGIIGHRGSAKRDERNRAAVKMQRFIEHRIMGDDYDSIRLGKNQLSESQWRIDEMFDVIFRGQWGVIRNNLVSLGGPERFPA